MLSKTEELTGEVSLHGFFDFGKDAFATLEFELEGEFTENTEVIIGEVAKDGKIVHKPGFKTFLQHIFQQKNGRHVYRFPIPPYIPAYGGFPYCTAPREADGEVAPFRYVEVNRYYGKVTLRRKAWFGDWNDDASFFTSSKPILNEVWDFCKYSIKATSLFDCYVDGERERMPYEGDAYINQLGHFCNDANFTIARNTLQHFMNQGQYTWPTEWLLLTPLMVRDYLYYSGDKESVSQWLPHLKYKLLPQFMTEEGLLAPALFADKGNADVRDENNHIIQWGIRDIIDYPPTEQDGYDLRQVNFVPNAYLYAGLLAMEDLTGDDSYGKRAQMLKTAIRKHFLKDGLFVDSLGSNHTGIHSAMFAIAFGLTEGSETAAHAAVLSARKMACSVYGAQFLLDACYQCGLAEHALSLMTSTEERSWVNMMREGATITMESWGDRWKANQDWNHAWGAAPANIIARRLCGIRPTAPGFTTFIVEPQPASLEEFHCVQPTIHGAIELAYSKDKGYRLTVPEGTQATYFGQTYTAGTHSFPDVAQK
ncbi:MAG: hypothetical protein GX946_07880 [Oligosphaeraceae bacterium]|nr:hypothetical protein [Oligosphaeraceae bacterium]